MAYNAFLFVFITFENYDMFPKIYYDLCFGERQAIFLYKIMNSQHAVSDSLPRPQGGGNQSVPDVC